MNEQSFESKAKENLEAVLDSGQTELNRLEKSTSKMKEQLTTWAEGAAGQLGRKAEELKSDAMSNVAVAAKTIEQDVNKGLNQYNSKVQELVDQVPGGFSKKTARYPWVTISISLAIGLLLGIMLKPTRRQLRSFGF